MIIQELNNNKRTLGIGLNSENDVLLLMLPACSTFLQMSSPVTSQ